MLVNFDHIYEKRQDKQLDAASSLPVIMVSGWKRLRYLPVRTSSTTFGSRSMYSDRGTCFPDEVSEKKVLNPSML